MADIIVDINLLDDLAKGGWKVEFSEKFYKHMLDMGSLESALMSTDDSDDDSLDWQGLGLSTTATIMAIISTSHHTKCSSEIHTSTGAVIAVVGLYDKGKTFVLNQITQSNLPSGKKVSTKGLSFKVAFLCFNTCFTVLSILIERIDLCIA